MIIDSHHHFWKYNTKEFDWIDHAMQILKRDFLPEHLEKECKANLIEGVVTIQARPSLEETRWLLSLADEHSFIKGVVGWVDLCSPNIEKQLEEFSANRKFVGVRHMVQSENDDHFMLRADFQAGLRLLSQYNLAYDLLIQPRHLSIAAQLVSEFPRQRFVIDHMGKPFIKTGELAQWKSDITALGFYKNVWCKISGLVTEADWNAWQQDDFQPYLTAVVHAFGFDRIMVGSDWPVCLVAASYKEVWNMSHSFFGNQPESVHRKFFRDNCKDFYNLQ